MSDTNDSALTDCTVCGADVSIEHEDCPDGWFCDHCGHYFDKILRECPVCGAKLDTANGYAIKADGHRWQHGAT